MLNKGQAESLPLGLLETESPTGQSEVLPFIKLQHLPVGRHGRGGLGIGRRQMSMVLPGGRAGDFRLGLFLSSLAFM